MPSDLEDLANQQQMTHQPEQPNPAAPYLASLRDLARRTFVDPLQTTGFVPGGQNWSRPAVNSMINFQQSGLTGMVPYLRQVMPESANALGDIVQSPAARSVFSTANIGGIPSIEPRFLEGRQLITSEINKLYEKGKGSSWIKTPEGGQGMYIRVRPSAIDVANVDFEKKGTGAFANYLTHIENEAKRLHIPIVNTENIFNDRLIPFLRNRGYIITNPRRPITMQKILR